MAEAVIEEALMAAVMAAVWVVMAAAVAEVAMGVYDALKDQVEFGVPAK